MYLIESDLFNFFSAGSDFQSSESDVYKRQIMMSQFDPRTERVKVFNPFKPEFTIVIFIHYKPRIAVAILDLQWMKMTWSGC